MITMELCRLRWNNWFLGIKGMCQLASLTALAYHDTHPHETLDSSSWPWCGLVPVVLYAI